MCAPPWCVRKGCRPQNGWNLGKVSGGGDSVIFLSKIYVANFSLCWGYIWPCKMQVWMYPQKSPKNSKKGGGRVKDCLRLFLFLSWVYMSPCWGILVVSSNNTNVFNLVPTVCDFVCWIFGEYFSEHSGVFVQIFQSIFFNSLVYFFQIFQSIFPNFEYFSEFVNQN